MKKWNAPEMVELNINETANGAVYACWEGELGNCVCGNNNTHGHNIITGEIITPGSDEGKGDTATPDTLS